MNKTINIINLILTLLLLLLFLGEMPCWPYRDESQLSAEFNFMFVKFLFIPILVVLVLLNALHVVLQRRQSWKHLVFNRHVYISIGMIMVCCLYEHTNNPFFFASLGCFFTTSSLIGSFVGGNKRGKPKV
jgi:hypothetical protein